MTHAVRRLTELSHGGGCGCKLSPAVLEKLLKDQPMTAPFAQLMVGAETSDDAAVWRVNDDFCVIATTDFFMPIVDDPHDFGRIAAANALSDVYAMGGKPIMALAIVGMPIDKLETEVIRRILQGGASICAEAGIPVAGGHSIDSQEPIYGLAVIGLCRPDQVRRNADARAGDAILLTKGVGVGVYSAAFKRNALSAAAYAEMIGSTTLLNRAGGEISGNPAVHAITDVTGFGLLGHALEMARGSGLRLRIEADAAPLLNEAATLAQQGFVTGASQRNWAAYGASCRLPDDFPDWRRKLFTDPQTSGGLLIACDPAAADSLAAELRAAGYPLTRIVGVAEQGAPEVVVS